jgi:hypothetical protein
MDQRQRKVFDDLLTAFCDGIELRKAAGSMSAKKRDFLLA